MILKRKRDHLSCYPIPLINIKITRQLYYLLRAVLNIKEIAFFCNKENHISHTCLKVSDPKIRFSILRRKNLCFICFKGGHLSVNCSKFKDYKCKKCPAKHNISLCSRQPIPVATPAEELQNTSTTLANFNNKNIFL